MTNEENKTFQNITDNLMQAADKFNDKEISDAAKKFSELIKAKLNEEGKKREQAQNHKDPLEGNFYKEFSKIKGEDTKNVVAAAHKFINGGKKRDIVLLLADKGLDSCFWDGNDEYVTEMFCHAMCIDKRLAAVLMSAVLSYIANNCKIEIKPYNK